MQQIKDTIHPNVGKPRGVCMDNSRTYCMYARQALMQLEQGIDGGALTCTVVAQSGNKFDITSLRKSRTRS